MYFEEDFEGRFKQSIAVEEKILQKQSKYQMIEIYKTKAYGKLLVLDGNGMFCDADEFIYHEMMAHVGINTHQEPHEVLIIGGGDLGVAREALRHECIKKVDNVEIDGDVVEVCKEHFSFTNEALKDERLNLIIQDGVEFVKNAKDKSYDIVFVDSTDPKDFAEPLFGEEFYDNVARILKDDGLVVSQAESYFLYLEQHKEILKTIGKNFYIAMPYRYEMIAYPGTLYNFVLASKKYHPTADINLQRADLMDGLRYYNSDIHVASFAKPTYIYKELLGIAKN